MIKDRFIPIGESSKGPKPQPVKRPAKDKDVKPVPRDMQARNGGYKTR